MPAQRIGFTRKSLRSWYESHLSLIVVLYLIALIPLTLLFGAIFLFDEHRFTPGTATIAWYFYFWLAFYPFATLLSRIAEQKTNKIVKREMLRARMKQSLLVLKALKRSREMTIPLREYKT